jgi:hypothetical protein
MPVRSSRARLTLGALLVLATVACWASGMLVWKLVLQQVFPRQQIASPGAPTPAVPPAQVLFIDLGRGATDGQIPDLTTLSTGFVSPSVLAAHCVDTDDNGKIVPARTVCSKDASVSGTVTAGGVGSAKPVGFAPVMSSGALVTCSDKAPSDDPSQALCSHVIGSGSGFTIATPMRK